MTTAEIIERVKTILDEITPYDDGLVIEGGSYPDMTYKYINITLQEGVNDMLNLLPIALAPLSEMIITISGNITEANNVITAKLPNDYIKLISVKLNSWVRPVTEFIGFDDYVYREQSNIYTRGNKFRPIVAVGLNSSGAKVLEAYTSRSGDIPVTSTMSLGTYIKTTAADELPDILIEPLSWLMASKIMRIFSNEKQSEIAFAEFIKIIQIRDVTYGRNKPTNPKN